MLQGARGVIAVGGTLRLPGGQEGTLDIGSHPAPPCATLRRVNWYFIIFDLDKVILEFLVLVTLNKKRSET